MVTGDSRVVVAKEQISSDLDGEAVILNLKSGVYYGLNAVGASIWNLIQQPKTISEIQDALLAQYEVEPEQCDRDLFAMLQEMEAEGLIEVSDETVA
ncbi:lasso peptide biosynthesis PqqD family chaperone [Nostoc sp. UHCC 0702]|nr:lasso peptide biosynthesis PqqD family chaperone [Nostoc sp. UHCC 0702]